MFTSVKFDANMNLFIDYTFCTQKFILSNLFFLWPHLTNKILESLIVEIQLGLNCMTAPKKGGRQKFNGLMKL